MTDETNELLPRHTPQPTFHPFLCAVAIGIMGWGLVTNWVLTAFGGLFLLYGISGWVRDIVLDWRSTRADGPSDS